MVAMKTIRPQKLRSTLNIFYDLSWCGLSYKKDRATSFHNYKTKTPSYLMSIIKVFFLFLLYILHVCENPYRLIIKTYPMSIEISKHNKQFSLFPNPTSITDNK